MTTSARAAPDLCVLDAQPTSADVRQAALAGLSAAQKTLPCSLLYDDVGAGLFRQICETPEYYPTRTELSILRQHLPSISTTIGTNARLIELGTGEGVKTRILLRGLKPLEYFPIDISRQQLLDTAGEVALQFPHIRVHAICADYTQPLTLPPSDDRIAHTVFFFPGSTIGNFEPEAAETFLQSLADLAGPEGGLLIGVDLHKDTRRLNAAYNDARGVTAAFNLNVLTVLNRQAGADFDTDQFEHNATYDTDHRRIEMRLVSKRKQRVRFASDTRSGEATIGFEDGESIVTEHSYKYSLGGFSALVQRSGWCVARTWLDAERLFAVHWCLRR